MDSISCYNSYIFFLFLILNVISLRADLISDVCHSSEDSDFCTKAFQSDPRSKTATLPDLEIIAIDLGTKSATGTIEKINSLMKGATDPRSKNNYSQCSDFYNKGIISALKAAKGFANAGNYDDVNTQAGGIMNFASSCENLFKQPPPISSPLSQDNLATQHYGEIIAIISERLKS